MGLRLSATSYSGTMLKPLTLHAADASNFAEVPPEPAIIAAAATAEPLADDPAAADVPLMDGSQSSEQNRLAVIADPQGAAFGIFSGALDP